MKTIPLTQGKFALVSDEDYERVVPMKWCLSYSPEHSQKMYAVSAIGGKRVSMHRFIVGAEKGTIIDHRNGDGLDNQRGNLREGTCGQNRANSGSKRDLPKGVYPRQQRTGGTVYRAQIRCGKRLTNLGTYRTIDAASAAYSIAASKFHGEFARTEN